MNTICIVSSLIVAKKTRSGPRISRLEKINVFFILFNLSNFDEDNMQASFSLTQPFNTRLALNQDSLGIFYAETKNRALSATELFSKHVQELLFDKTNVQEFLTGAELFFADGGNPNLLFRNISIRGENDFYQPVFFHLVYLAWKWPDADWSPEIDDRFDKLFDKMLDDARTELAARFS